MGRRIKKGSQTRAIGYIRVSTSAQDLGPQAQMKALDNWCKANDVELVATYTDKGISGATRLEKRPGLLDALDALRDEDAGFLIVAKRDRLARDIVVGAMCERMAERNGARIVAADGTGNSDSPEAELMRNLVTAFAQYERQIIAARTRRALAVKKAKGERTGQVPFGYQLSKDGARIEENAGEQSVIELIVELRGRGLSIRKIADELNGRGVPARGKKWHRTSIANILGRIAA
ncbi:MAG: recombinase family protein [Deltaproteobacteria bacterium]|nr:recombinase family protein [Deltaproteobacteria bacterium]